MKIVDIKATAHHIEVPLPLFAKNVVTRRIVFCEVTTDEGLTGYGLTGGQFLPWSVIAALEHDFLETVRGMDPRDTEAIHEKIWWGLNMRAVREAIGPDIELMLDANYKFSPIDAKLLCREIEDLNIVWFEEPLFANDVRAMADLRRSTRIPISAGQMEGHRWRFKDLIEAQAVDILQPNVCYNGGYTETQKVAHMAQAL